MRVVGQHSLRYVPGDRHDRSIARLGFGQLRYGVMSQVVEAQASGRALDLAYISTAFGVAADSRIVEEFCSFPQAGQFTARVRLLHAERQPLIGFVGSGFE